MKPPGSSETSLAIRALVIGYKPQIGLGWMEISMKLGIQPDTARKLYELILSTAGILDLFEILKYIDSVPGEGSLRTVKPGSEEFHQVRTDVLKWKHFNRIEAANYTRPYN